MIRFAGHPATACWTHLPFAELDAGTVAQFIANWQLQYNWSFCKITLQTHHYNSHWNTVYQPGQRLNGAYVQIGNPIHTMKQLEAFLEIHSEAVVNGFIIDVVKTVATLLPANIPVISTVFCPLKLIRTLVSDDLLKAILEDRTALALGIFNLVTRTIKAHLEALKSVRAHGIFWVVDRADLYYEYPFLRQLDLEILSQLDSPGDSILHVHHPIIQSAREIAYFKEYPLSHLNAHFENDEQLLATLETYQGNVIGGIDVDQLCNDDPNVFASYLASKMAAFKSYDNFILAPTCSIRLDTPERNLRALSQACTASRPRDQQGTARS